MYSEMMIERMPVIIVKGVNNDYVYFNHEKSGLFLDYKDIEMILNKLYSLLIGIKGYKNVELKSNCIKLIKW